MALPKTHWIYEDDRPICSACKEHCDTYIVDESFDAWGPMGTTITVHPVGNGKQLSICCDAEVK